MYVSMYLVLVVSPLEVISLVVWANIRMVLVLTFQFLR